MKKGGLGSRLLVAAWGIPLLLAATWFGGWWIAALIAGISVLGQIEYYRMQKNLMRNPFKWWGVVIGLSIVFTWKIGYEVFHWVFCATFLVFAVYALLRGRSHQDIIATLGGVIYIPLLAGSFVFIRGWEGGYIPDEGRWLTLGIWGAIWVCDTAAYAGGRFFGKHKLAPTISPNKTIEGFVFGFAGAILFSIIWWKVGLIEFDVCLVSGIAAGLFGQIGDLAESSFKRECEVKDSSSVLPGHGGILDRFDSLLFAAPIVAMYLFIRPDILFYL